MIRRFGAVQTTLRHRQEHHQDHHHDATDRGAPAIVAEGLTRTFGDVTAVDDLDLVINRGEIYGFLGPNGAGKSTTVRMLCTLLAPTGGRASVAGFDVAARPQQVRLRIGVALQDVALDPKQTGLELLRLQGRLYGLTRREIEQRLVELRALIDLGDALDRRIGTYSGGMKRRLDLAAALVHNPEVLFLDEPTTGLDPVSRASVWEEVQRLNDELGMTIFLTTQYLEEADALADRVGIIDHGRLVAEGTPAELKRNDRHRRDRRPHRRRRRPPRRTRSQGVDGVVASKDHDHELTISVDDGSATIGPVAVALHDASIRVRDLTLRTPTLDDVFLELTGRPLRRRGGSVMTTAQVTFDIRPRTAPDVARARPAGFVHDVLAIAGRALRAVPRDLEADPAAGVHRLLLLHREHRHAAEPHRSTTSRASTTPRSRCRPRSCSASPACRGRRPSWSTCRTATSTGCCSPRCGGCAILLGHMVADVAVSATLCVPILGVGVRARRALPGRSARGAGVHRHRRRSGASRSPASGTRSR